MPTDGCDLISLAHNITYNCDNDIEVVKDTCQVICLMTIVKTLDACYFDLFKTGLLDQLKSIIKWCYYKKYEGGAGH